MTGSFNLLDASGPGRWLEEIAAAQGAGHDDAFIVQLAAHLRTALEKPLKKHEAAMRVVEHLPARAPPGWPEEKWGAVLERHAGGSGETFHQFDPSLDTRLQEHVSHVADWIAAALVNDASWLREADERGRPKKLLKIGSLAQAEKLADQALRRAFNRAVHPVQAFEAERATGDIEIVMELPDGSRWVRLLTPAALDAERAQMGHCVGAGAYARLLKGTHRYYSLRDARNEPHATLEVDTQGSRLRHWFRRVLGGAARGGGGRLLQCQGKDNKAPVARYMPAIRDFMLREGLSLKGMPVSRTGLIEQDGRYYDIHSLPEGLKITGDLDLRYCARLTLPRGLTVGGDFFLHYAQIAALPAGLTVAGDLWLGGSGITALPAGLTVAGDLWLNRSAITTLPEDLQVGGSLDLCGTKVTTLPENLSVGGRIYTDGGAFDSVAEARRAFAAQSARASQGPAP